MDTRSPSRLPGLRLALLALTSGLLLLGLDVVPVAASGDGDTDARPRRIALGVSMPYCHDLAKLDRFSASIGGATPALWTVWSQWGVAGSREFPTGVANGLGRRGVTPFIFWEPWDMDHPADRGFRYARIVAGDHDAYIRRFARDARDFGGPVLLRFAHEANGAYFPWGVRGPLDNTIRDYKRAWRHIWRIFRAVGADNVRFVWSLVKQGCPGGCDPYRRLYPGDRYVDFMGFSSYNWGAIRGKRWKSMLRGYRRVTTLLSAISDKPIIVAETGSNDIGGDKATWIRNGYPRVRRELPRIAAILYLNYDLRKLGHPDWSLGSTPAALRAYAEVADRPGFGGGFTRSGSVR